MHDRDCLHRFVFEQLPDPRPPGAPRCRLARADRAPASIRRRVRDTLGEAVAASLLLAATIKFDGVLSLQLQGDGPVQLMLAQCTSGLGVRGLARYREEATSRRARRRRRGRRRRTDRRGQSDRDAGDRRRRAALPGHRADRRRCAWPSRCRAISRTPSSCRRACGCTPTRAAPPACCCSGCRGPARAGARRRALRVDDAWRRVQLIGETLTPEELRDARRRARSASAVQRGRRARCSTRAGVFPLPLLARARRRHAAGAGRERDARRCWRSAARSRCAAISAIAPMCSMRSTWNSCSSRRRRQRAARGRYTRKSQPTADGGDSEPAMD